MTTNDEVLNHLGAVKELKTKIDSLQTEVNTLKAS
jgi:uncharacterized small protein (DUF1192 family)